MKAPLHLVIPLALLLAACSGSKSGGTANGDACTQTLARACATQLKPGQVGVSCIDSWDQVQTDQRYCSLPADEYSADCGAYDVLLVVGGANSDFAYYYDTTSGKLVAVVWLGGTYSGPQCVGGPAEFKPPANCPTFTSFMTCP